MNESRVEVIATERTVLGELCLQRRELPFAPGSSVTEITLDHEFLMSSYLTASERALSEIALAMHPGPALNVLVGGLGLGYTAHSALESDRVSACDVVEFLPEVIDWLKRGMIPLAGELNGDERLNVVRGDVYARLAGPPSRAYDLILIDVDHSPDENLGGANAAFYTNAGLQRAKLHLAEGGVLGVWSYADSSPFSTALREVFDDVRLEAVTVWNDLVHVMQTDWLFFARDRPTTAIPTSRSE